MTGRGSTDRVSTYKILFSGPVRAGKTTAIESLSDKPPVRTDMDATDRTRNLKPNTTVALDFGVMGLSGTQQLHLYGTPGQERFDFMWDILSTGALGLALMIDNDADDPVADLEFFVGAYRAFIQQTALVVGVTHTDLAPVPTVDDHVAVLARLGVRAPVFTIDARHRSDVARLIEALLFSLDTGVDGIEAS